MINHQIILFMAIPLAAGLISVTTAKNLFLSRLIGCVSLGGMVTMGVILLWLSHRDDVIYVSQLGNWQAPFGISIIFDSLSGLLITAASTVALGAYIHSFDMLEPDIERRYYHPLIQLLIFGVNLSFLTGDLFNLFVAFEIMLLASYALLTLGGTRKQLTQAYKYVLLNLLASTIFVMTAGMVYGMFGTLNMADLARIVHEIQADPDRELPTGFTALSITLLLVFGLKGAFFPLWFWLPDTYYTCPISIAGLFGGVLTKVGVYSVARTFPLIFAVGEGSQLIILIIAVASAFTMFLGVLGAVSQHEIRRILSIHVISQIGYMMFGIAIMTGWALAGCVFFMIHNMVVKCALFLCCGAMEKHAGTDDLDRLGGLLKRDVFLAVLFFIAALSLVGLPPLSGFFGKLVIIREGWPYYWGTLSIVGLLTGSLTLLSMLKIWGYGFWNPTPKAHPIRTDAPTVKRNLKAAYTGIVFLVGTALFLGFAAEPVCQVALRAGEQLEDPVPYISAVLRIDPDVLRVSLEAPAAPQVTLSAAAEASP